MKAVLLITILFTSCKITHKITYAGINGVSKQWKKLHNHNYKKLYTILFTWPLEFQKYLFCFSGSNGFSYYVCLCKLCGFSLRWSQIIPSALFLLSKFLWEVNSLVVWSALIGKSSLTFHIDIYVQLFCCCDNINPHMENSPLKWASASTYVRI